MIPQTIKKGTTFRASLVFTREGEPVDLQPYSTAAKIYNRERNASYTLTVDVSEAFYGIIHVVRATDDIPVGQYVWDVRFVAGATDKFAIPTLRLTVEDPVS
jgi:hypothetical protein